jgi:hypothetical protein
VPTPSRKLAPALLRRGGKRPSKGPRSKGLSDVAVAGSGTSPMRIWICLARALQGLFPQLRAEFIPGARIHTSRSSSVVRITGIALEWIGSTAALGAVVKKP